MSHEEHRAPRSSRKTNVLASAPGLVSVGFLAIAGALFFTEHRAHIVLGALIWIILVAGLVLPAFTQGGWRGSNRRDGG